MVRTFSLALALVIGLALLGCQSNKNHQGHDDYAKHDAKHGHGDHDDATEVTIRMDEVPAAVRQSFEREFPGAKLHEVERETYRSGTVHYCFDFTTREGKKMEVEFSSDGERLPEH